MATITFKTTKTSKNTAKLLGSINNAAIINFEKYSSKRL